MTDPAAPAAIPAITAADARAQPGGLIDEQGRAEPPMAAEERQTLTGFLDYQRATLHWKVSGLTAEDLKLRVAASTMTLGGILTHLAWVEEHWFTGMFLGQDLPEPWARADRTVDPDWEWSLAARQSPAQNFALWQQAVARSRDTLTRADDLDALASRSWPDGQRPSLRWIVVHMIEEYARHNGHADLIREAIDGSTGE
ncbi:MAG TPA: DinB family protein [Ruania sp.]|nr:DinB family protein [Ruania sp.]